MGTARVKQVDEAETGIIVKEEEEDTRVIAVEQEEILKKLSGAL